MRKKIYEIDSNIFTRFKLIDACSNYCFNHQIFNRSKLLIKTQFFEKINMQRDSNHGLTHDAVAVHGG